MNATTPLTAPLAPEHYADDPAPLFERLWIETEIARAFADLHAAVTPQHCTTCGATGKQRCREGGKFVGRHPGRAA